jgi:hypothetical protein
MITQSELRELLHYDPLTGVFTWLIANGRRIHVGDEAGWEQSRGYRQITINNKMYLASRLAWLYMIGVWPKNLIDHIDTNQHNNKWDNLREATHSQNKCNTTLTKANTTGVKNVSYNSRKRKWKVQISKKFLGYFDKIEDAEAVAKIKRKELHGDFARDK